MRAMMKVGRRKSEARKSEMEERFIKIEMNGILRPSSCSGAIFEIFGNREESDENEGLRMTAEY